MSARSTPAGRRARRRRIVDEVGGPGLHGVPIRMPNLDFHATGPDIPQLLDFVFDRTSFRVFEFYSRPNRALREFRTPAEAMEAYGEAVRAPSLLLQLVVPSAARLFRIERSALSNPVGYRERIMGWGLIQLDLGGDGPGGIRHSHTNHFSQIGARAAAGHAEGADSPSSAAWNWTEVRSASAALNRHIRRCAAGKLDSRPVLPSAHAAFLAGKQPEDAWGRSLAVAYRLGVPTGRRDQPETKH